MLIPGQLHPETFPVGPDHQAPAIPALKIPALIHEGDPDGQVDEIQKFQDFPLEIFKVRLYFATKEVRMRTAAILCLFLVLAGCAPTLHEMQQSPPSLTISSGNDSKTLANKLAYELTQESLKSRMFPDWDPARAVELDNGVQKIMVTFTSRGNILLIPYAPQAVAEITITPADNGGSRLEYRGLNWSSSDKLLAVIQSCASPKTAPENNPE